MRLVVLGGLVVASMPLDTRFEGSNPAEQDGFLWAIKTRSTTYIGGEEKTSAPYRKMLPYVKTIRV
jgi:hypothetical protein